jgi:hypothetical protein
VVVPHDYKSAPTAVSVLGDKMKDNVHNQAFENF